MSLSDRDPVFDKFFDNVINAKDHDTLKTWLKKQSADEIKYFLYTFQGWNHENGKQSLLRIQLENMESQYNARDKWLDRIVGFVSGIGATLVTTYLVIKLGLHS